MHGNIQTETVPKIVLRDYQKEMLNAVWMEAVGADRSTDNCGPIRLACVQPTGAGKTIEILSLADKLSEMKKWRTLIIVPTRKLVRQTVQKAEEFFPKLKVGSVAGGKWNVSEDDHVVIGTAAGISGKKLKILDPGEFQMLVIDEAHHITAASYIRLLRYFSGAVLQIGLTATFRRGDGVSILADEYFPTLLVWHTVAQLTDQGFLSPARGSFVYTNTNLAEVKKRSNGDFDERDLAIAVDTPERNTAAVRAWIEKAKGAPDYPEGRPTVCFTVGIGHAKHLAEEFKSHGVNAAAVWGAQDEKQQQQIFDDYRSGKIKVLTNAMLLTEGWDEPSTSCVLIARPATAASSFVLGPQMIGRGLRIYPGKKDALIIELRDSADDSEEGENSLLAATMDLSEKEITEDEPLHEQKKKAEKRAFIEEVEYLAGQIGEVEFTSELFDVIEKLEKVSRLAWIPLGSRMCMNLSAGDFLEIVEDPDGRFLVNLVEKGTLRHLKAAPTRSRAMVLGENWLIANRRDHTFVQRDAEWRAKSPTGAAVNRACKLTGRQKKELSAMTRGEISDLINAAMSIKQNAANLKI